MTRFDSDMPGAVPKPVPVEHTEGFLLGKGDVLGALGAHFEKDGAHQKAVMERFKALDKLKNYGRGMIGMMTLLIAFAGTVTYFTRLWLADTVRPIIQAQSQQAQKQEAVESIAATLRDFRESAEKANERLEKLETRRGR